ncbi:transposase [Ensifer sp. NBAIM29]|nr:transposase [Ensifer sp. NBAIM29]
MADENNLGPVTADPETVTDVKIPTAKKPKSPRRQKAVAEAAQSKTPAKPRRYSEQERNDKLQLIETRVSEGKSTLKDAIKGAGISEQTYYQWKKTAKPVEQKAEKPVATGNEFADLVALEEENQRLRKLLAEKLRAENADLRKRLGLD